MAKLNDLSKQSIPKVEDKEHQPKTNPVRRRAWLEDMDEESILLIDTNDISNWEYHDRPQSELGDIESLSRELISIGQLVPCIVRNAPTGSRHKYELIAGERRWRAAQLANIKLKCIVKNISDSESALIQSAENDNRKDLSDYAKGVSYDKLIQSGIITQQDLVEKLGRNKQYVSALLSFSKIPQEIINAVGDFSKVSARTAETIKRLSSKGKDHIEAIINLASNISDGKIGANKLAEKIESAVSISRKQYQANNIKIKSNDGRHIFTWRNDNNSNPSIHFPKDISHLISEDKISLENLTNAISKEISNELSKIK
jgi:ParB/RepB/Spo0J family partition protein